MASQGRIRIGIAGAAGRMGRAVAAAVEARPDMELSGLYDLEGTEGSIVDGRTLTTRLETFNASQVVIDFTNGAASADLALRDAMTRGPALVIGSTGFSAEEEAQVADMARYIPIVKSGNFSLGVNVLVGLASQAARVLAARDYDIEVFEAHHRRKIDAPSGTALMLGKAAAAGRGESLKDVETRARDGLTGPRKEGTIGFSVARGGGIVGEHSVIFAAEDEIITLSHSARDRSLFARGAVEAAAWIAGRDPGLYDMQDVLGFK